MSFAIGVDLGGTNLRIAAVDERGRLLEKITLGTQVSLGRDAVISEMAAAIQALTAKFKDGSKLLGVGIGVPGIIDCRTGMLRESPNLPGWDNYPVRDEIEKRLQTSVILENDANVAGLGEAWLGAAKGIDNVCMITLGTGVGGGIVQNGRIWQGMSGMAGEVGHVTIDPNGPKCNCGNSGCAERFASATAIVQMARHAIAAGEAPALARIAGSPDVEFSARTVYNLALQGDKAALRIFEKVGWALGILIADLVNVLNLDMYVIGGGVCAAWQSFSPALFAELSKRSMVYAATAPDQIPGTSAGAAPEVHPLKSAKRTIVTRALLGSDAGLYGAARLPMVTSDIRTHSQEV
jgi:glucokinase